MIDIEKLKQLRVQTGVSLSLCKKALLEADNQLTKAKQLLKNWGAEKVAAKAGRPVTQGAIFTYLHHNKQVASMIELLCETDFVAANDQFHHLGQELAIQLASMPETEPKQFLQQVYVRDPKQKVSDLIQAAILKFGENIRIGRLLRWKLGEQK